MEVLVQIDAGELVQDIDDGMGVTIGQGTVIFVAIPAVMFRTPYTVVSLEFVNTDGLREFGWPAEMDGLKDRLDGALGTWFLLATSEKARGCIRSRRMES